MWEEGKVIFDFTLKQLMAKNCLEVKPQTQAPYVVREKLAKVSSRQEERAGFPNADLGRQLQSLAFLCGFQP